MKARQELHKRATFLIKAHPAFSAADKAVISRVLAGDGAILRDTAKSAPVLPCHSPKNAVALLLNGKCHICIEGKITATKAEGSLFGLEDLCPTLARQNAAIKTVIAAEGCRVLYLKAEAVDEITQSSAQAATAFSAWVLQQEAEMNARLQAQSNNVYAEERLAEYILSKRKNEGGEAELPRDMQKLAKHLGINKNRLYSALEQLNSTGAIAMKGTKIYANKTELEKYTGRKKKDVIF